MCKGLLVMLLTLSALLTADFLFVTNHAAAGCCMCGTCKPWLCTCRGPGVPGCPQCALPGPFSLRKEIRDSGSIFLVEAVTSARFPRLTIDGSCTRNRQMLRLMDRIHPIVEGTLELDSIEDTGAMLQEPTLYAQN